MLHLLYTVIHICMYLLHCIYLYVCYVEMMPILALVSNLSLMFLHVCVCMYIYIHTYTYIYIYIHIYIYNFI